MLANSDVLDPPETDTHEDQHYETAGDLLKAAAAEEATAADPQTDELPPPTESPEELRRLHYDEIVSLGRRVDEAKRNMDTLKLDAKAATEEYKGLLGAHQRLIRRDPMQRPLPLGEPVDVGDSDEPLPVDDSWKRIDVSALDLTPSATNNLYTGGIMTLGDLSDFWKGGKVLTDIKGIGEASDAAIRDAFSNYGVAHPEVFGEQASGSEDPDDDSELDPDEPDADDDDIDGT